MTHCIKNHEFCIKNDEFLQGYLELLRRRLDRDGLLVRFYIDFGRLGTMQTAIILERGIKIKKSRNCVRSSLGSDSRSHFWSLLSLLWVLGPTLEEKMGSKTHANNKKRKTNHASIAVPRRASPANGVNLLKSNHLRIQDPGSRIQDSRAELITLSH